MVRLVVTDIDGTLLHDQASDIIPEYFRVIREMKKAGILFCAASGRQFKSLSRLFAPVENDVLFIAQNGAEIRYKGRQIFCRPMTMEASKELVADTRSIPGAQSMYCTGDTAYFEKGDTDVYHLMKEEYRFDCTMVEDLMKLEEPCLKFSLYLKENVDEITACNFTPKWKKTHEAACGGKYFMDVMERGVNKGSALAKVQEMLGIKKEETIAFGDNHNDLEMFEQAGTSFAVANARDEVKAVSSFVIAGNNEDGVLLCLKKVLEDAVVKGSENIFSIENNNTKSYSKTTEGNTNKLLK